MTELPYDDGAAEASGPPSGGGTLAGFPPSPPNQRRPPARSRASGNPRSRAMAATPRNGPTASEAKAQRQPTTPATAGMSQMLSVVSAKPTHVWLVSAVPT